MPANRQNTNSAGNQEVTFKVEANRQNTQKADNQYNPNLDCGKLGEKKISRWTKLASFAKHRRGWGYTLHPIINQKSIFFKASFKVLSDISL